jgi:hypothetical protein
MRYTLTLEVDTLDPLSIHTEAVRQLTSDLLAAHQPKIDGSSCFRDRIHGVLVAVTAISEARGRGLAMSMDVNSTVRGFAMSMDVNSTVNTRDEDSQATPSSPKPAEPTQPSPSDRAWRSCLADASFAAATVQGQESKACEHLTDRARKVMQLANQEAQRFNHEYIGTEHILLGLVKEGTGVAANVLKNLDIDLRKIRFEVEKIVQVGPDMVTTGKLPQTPKAKKVIEYSIEEARQCGYDYAGTEHLLLGLLREQEGVAAQVLTHLGLSVEAARKEIDLLTSPCEDSKPAPATATPAAGERLQADNSQQPSADPLLTDEEKQFLLSRRQLAAVLPHSLTSRLVGRGLIHHAGGSWQLTVAGANLADSLAGLGDQAELAS